MYCEELGKEIPKGWVLNTLGMHVDVKGGKRLPSGHSLVDNKTQHPYIRVTDVNNGFIDKANIKFIENETWEQVKRYTITVDDIFISIAGTIGLVGLIDAHLDNANLTENMAKLCNINNAVISQCYILLYLKSEFGRNQITSRTVGSTQPKLALFRIKDIEILVPSRDTMNLFHNAVKSFYSEIFNMRNENYQLTQIRDALLPKLMSGELAVDEVEV